LIKESRSTIQEWIRKRIPNNRRPVELLFYEKFSDPYAAFRLEKQIKGWRRRKKEALIAGDFDKLVEYSKSCDKLKGKQD